MRRFTFAIFTCALLASGCAEPRLGPAEETWRQPPPARTLIPVAELSCSVDLSDHTFECGSARSAPTGEGVAAATSGDAIIGRQHWYARVANASDPSIQMGAGPDGRNVITVPVTLQNLTLQPWGTYDGAQADGDGIRVFFTRKPPVTVLARSGNGNVSVVADDQGHFTRSDILQPYYVYGPSETGDGILEPGEVSAPKTWTFYADPDVSSWEIGVLVYAAVPDLDALSVHLDSLTSNLLHTCGWNEEGVAYCWGPNVDGRLGSGEMGDPSSLPLRVQGPPFRQLAAGTSFTCGLALDGNAYCWGSNFRYALGIGETDSNYATATPALVAGGHQYVHIAAGTGHACGLTASGEAYCWGYNAYGQLGNNATGNSPTPVQVANSGSGGLQFTHVFAGAYFTCGLATVGGQTGKAYCWGDNERGQIGNGTAGSESIKTPAAVAGDHSFITGDTDYGTACAITDTHRLYCWGDNTYGQIGNGQMGSDQYETEPTLVDFTGDPDDADPPVTDVAVGEAHVCAIAGGELYCWGSNVHGQLGDPTASSDSPRPYPGKVDLGHIASYGVDVTPKRIAAGGNRTCAVSEAGPVYCWGENGSGGLGDGLRNTRRIPSWVAGTK